jgi:hypothetical protein
MGGVGGAIGAVQSGEAQAAGYRQDEQNAVDKYWGERIKANQVDTSMTQHLTSTLANINAVRAASGAEMASPSGTAVENATLGLGLQDIGRSVQNLDNEALQQYQKAQFYANAAQQAQSNEGLGVIGALVGGLGGLVGKLF